MPVLTPYNELAVFFDVAPEFELLDRDLAISSIVARYDRIDIETAIPDRAPFSTLEKAIIFSNDEDRQCALTLSRVEEKDCEGHIPEQPMIPLILLSKAMALTGRLLGGYLTKSGTVAEVIRTGPVSSLLSFSDLQYAKPPVCVLTLAQLISQEKREMATNCTSWIVAPSRFVPAGKIETLTYALLPKELLLRALRGGSRTLR